MMKRKMQTVRLLISRAGAGFTQNAGDLVEVDADEASRLIAAGKAEIARRSKPETAVPRGARPEKAG